MLFLLPIILPKAKLILTADKTAGRSPLTVKFSGKIQGNTNGIKGHVPDYFFFPQNGKSVIPYSLPDTSQYIRTNWNDEITYNFPGGYKVVLLYQGIKEEKSMNLLSDTLFIKVN